ncbi:MAG TPA: sulfurtransferase [Gemmatimonadaceae bacterium]
MFISRLHRAAWLAGVLCATICTTTAGAQVHDDFVVTPAWLAAHLKDPSVVVLAVVYREMGDDKAYADAHIPGARAIDGAQFGTKRDVLDLELPPAEELRARFEALGISDSTRVVVYASNPPAATRLLFTLDYLGHTKFSLLDGGIKRWVAEGRPVTRDIPSVNRGHLTSRPQPGVVATADWIQAHPGNRGLSLIDTRSDGEYLGTGERHGMPSEGHLAGAHQLEWQALFTDADGNLKDKAELQKLYADRVRGGDTVVTYCWIGYRGSATYFVARYLGYPTKLYDGSYQDWLARKLPVRAGSAP